MYQCLVMLPGSFSCCSVLKNVCWINGKSKKKNRIFLVFPGRAMLNHTVLSTGSAPTQTSPACSTFRHAIGFSSWVGWCTACVGSPAVQVTLLPAEGCGSGGGWMSRSEVSSVFCQVSESLWLIQRWCDCLPRPSASKANSKTVGGFTLRISTGENEHVFEEVSWTVRSKKSRPWAAAAAAAFWKGLLKSPYPGFSVGCVIRHVVVHDRLVVSSVWWSR